MNQKKSPYPWVKRPRQTKPGKAQQSGQISFRKKSIDSMPYSVYRNVMTTGQYQYYTNGQIRKLSVKE